MPGINELLILAAVVTAIFLLPRIFKSKRKAPERQAARATLSGQARLAIAVSIFWLGAAAATIEPWKGDPLPFIYFGIAPIISVWALKWVLEGFKKK